jgi:cyclin-dependent kinase 7
LKRMSVVNASEVTDRYERRGELGQGTFGVVHDAVRRSDGLRVAIKRSKPMDTSTGLNFTALREVNYMLGLQCPYIVALVDVFLTGDSLHMVMEYCPFDLKDVIYDKKIFLTEAHIKSYMKMLLQGLEACHENFILHRDLKPANVLVGLDGKLKLADFGYARSFSSPREMTSKVVTLAYRPPELLFEAIFYGAAVDMWAVGCMFAEFMLRHPLFPGTSELDQLAKIFNIMGTPTEANWPNCGLLPSFVDFEQRAPLRLQDIFANATPETLDLMKELLTLDPQRRITAVDALKHPYFSAAPAATNPEKLPRLEK